MARPRRDPPRLYTTDEVAELTGRKAVTIKLRSLRFQAKGQKFGQKIGRQWLYTEDDIREIAAIPAHRGRTDRDTIERRKTELASVPLDQLAALADEPKAPPESAAS